MTIYDRIKALREQAGMSQQELAEKVGFKTASAVNKIELGLRDINQTKIMLFAKALNTTPSFLMGWEITDDEWSKKFRASLCKALLSIDTADIQAIGIDIERLNHIAYGSSPISLSDACEISDVFGFSLDEMVGKAKPVQMNGFSEIDYRIVNCFMALPEEKRRQALDYLNYLASQLNK